MNLVAPCTEPAVIRRQQIEAFPIDKLRPNPRNARTHSKKQIRQIAKALRDSAGPIRSSSMRTRNSHRACPLLAAQLLGYREVPIIVLSGLSDPEKRALALGRQ